MKTTSACFAVLRQLRVIRRSVPRTVFQLLVSCLVLPRLDYCNAVLAGIPFHRLAVWLSGNALASINVVALRQTRLVLGWVTVCGRVNHFGM